MPVEELVAGELEQPRLAGEVDRAMLAEHVELQAEEAHQAGQRDHEARHADSGVEQAVDEADERTGRRCQRASPRINGCPW